MIANRYGHIYNHREMARTEFIQERPKQIHDLLDSVELSSRKKFLINVRDDVVKVHNDAAWVGKRASTVDLFAKFGFSYGPMNRLLHRARVPLAYAYDQRLSEALTIPQPFGTRRNFCGTDGFVETINNAAKLKQGKPGKISEEDMMFAILESGEVADLYKDIEGASLRLAQEVELHKGEKEMIRGVSQLVDRSFSREERLQMLEELRGVFTTHPNPNS